MGKYIYLFIGESGCGKTTICNALAQDGYKQLWSYTTRKPRYDNEPGHVFVDSFPQNTQCVAYTKFDNCEYWATAEQVEEADTYVVDPAGLQWFLSNYHGSKQPIVFFLDTSRRTRKRRMKARGDCPEDIRRRLKHDKVEFAEFRYDAYRCSDKLPLTIVIDNNASDSSGLDRVRDYIHFFEEGDPDTDIIRF